ncbi:hypothetical protein MY11210_005125 [Beauveria gryllotalpidicola]
MISLTRFSLPLCNTILGSTSQLQTHEVRSIEEGEEYEAFTERILSLSDRIDLTSDKEEPAALKTERRTLYEERATLKSRKLREKQLAQKLDYDVHKEPYEEVDWKRGHFQRIKHMLPEARIRLRSSMKLSALPREELWKQTIEDLASLRRLVQLGDYNKHVGQGLQL